jgi:Tfp pilus assembly protein PilN
VAWNPLRSERDMFRFLMQVGAFCVVVIVLVVVIRAIF